MADADELVVAAVVGQQRDDHRGDSRRVRGERVHQAVDVVALGLDVHASSPSSRAVSLVTGPIDTTRAPSGSSPPASRKKRTVELEVKVT